VCGSVIASSSLLRNFSSSVLSDIVGHYENRSLLLLTRRATSGSLDGLFRPKICKRQDGMVIYSLSLASRGRKRDGQRRRAKDQYCPTTRANLLCAVWHSNCRADLDFVTRQISTFFVSPPQSSKKKYAQHSHFLRCGGCEPEKAPLVTLAPRSPENRERIWPTCVGTGTNQTCSCRDKFVVHVSMHRQICKSVVSQRRGVSKLKNTTYLVFLFFARQILFVGTH